MENIKLHRVSRLGLTNKKRTNQDFQNNELLGDSRYDFLPVVKINKSEEPKNAIISLKECKTHEKSKINLGSDYDKKHRKYIIADIIIAKNSTAKIPLIVKRGYDPLGFQDGDGILEFKSSKGSVKMNYIDNDDTDYEETKKKYDLKDAAYGDELVLEIKAKALARGTSFAISVYASDDKTDGYFGTNSSRRGICGKFNIKVVEKDVFIKSEINKQISELKYIQDFADQELSPEYDENYCMQSAERGLSELLNNSEIFYSVHRKTHKHKNSIGFSGKNVYDRGNDFVKKGYVQTTHTFDKYKINQSQKKLIYNSKNKNEAHKNYKKVKYTIVELPKKNKKIINNFFINDLKNKKIGYHVYYFTVTNGFHTLTLIINNSAPCNATYEIWDQHGITSSSGALNEIAEGIRKQTSWTFANTCLNRYYNNNTKFHDSTETKLWKIQRK